MVTGVGLLPSRGWSREGSADGADGRWSCEEVGHRRVVLSGSTAWWAAARAVAEAREGHGVRADKTLSCTSEHPSYDEPRGPCFGGAHRWLVAPVVAVHRRRGILCGRVD